MTNNPIPIMPSIEFIKNIEEAILEHGIIACPNPKCFDKLVSKKKWDINLGKTIEYGCKNPNCTYHSKRQIILNDFQEEKVKSNSNFKIMGITASVLFLMLVYISYHLYSLNEYIESEMENIETFAKEVEKKTFKKEEEKVNKKPTYPSQNISFKEENKTPTINIADIYTKTELLISSNNFKEGKIYFEKFLEDKNFENALLQEKNKSVKQQFILLIGDSYQKSKPQFSYHLLKSKQDFELMKSFIEKFDNDKELYDVLLGKAYLNAPNFLSEKISLKERKQMQLKALSFYISATKNTFLGDYHRSTLNAIQEISKLYKIFEFNPSKPKGYSTFEQLVKEDDKNELQNRIDYLERIIRKI